MTIPAANTAVSNGLPIISVLDDINAEANLIPSLVRMFDTSLYGAILRGEVDTNITNKMFDKNGISQENNTIGTIMRTFQEVPKISMAGGADPSSPNSQGAVYTSFNSINHFYSNGNSVAMSGIPISNIQNNSGDFQTPFDERSVKFKVSPRIPFLTRLHIFDPNVTQDSENFTSVTVYGTVNMAYWMPPSSNLSEQYQVANALITVLNTKLYKAVLENSGRPFASPYSDMCITLNNSLGAGFNKKYHTRQYLTSTPAEALGRLHSGEVYPETIAIALQSYTDEILRPSGGMDKCELWTNYQMLHQWRAGLGRGVSVLNSGSQPTTINDSFMAEYLSKQKYSISRGAFEAEDFMGIKVRGVDHPNLEVVSGTEANGVSRGTSIGHFGVVQAFGTTVYSNLVMQAGADFLSGGTPVNAAAANSSAFSATTGSPAIASGAFSPIGGLRIVGVAPVGDYGYINPLNESSTVSAMINRSANVGFPNRGNGTTGSFSTSSHYNQNTLIEKSTPIRYGYNAHSLLLGLGFPQLLFSGQYMGAGSSGGTSATGVGLGAAAALTANGGCYKFKKGSTIVLLPHAITLKYGAYNTTKDAQKLSGFDEKVLTMTIARPGSVRMRPSYFAAANSLNSAAEYANDITAAGAAASASSNAFVNKANNSYYKKLQEMYLPSNETSRHSNYPVTCRVMENAIMKFDSVYSPNAGLFGAGSRLAAYSATTASTDIYEATNGLNCTAQAGTANIANEYSLAETRLLKDSAIEYNTRLSGGSILVNMPISTCVTNITNYQYQTAPASFATAAANFNDSFGYVFSQLSNATNGPGGQNALNYDRSIGIDLYTRHPADDVCTTSAVALNCSIASNVLRYGRRGQALRNSANNGDMVLFGNGAADQIGIFMNPEGMFSGTPVQTDFINSESTNAAYNTTMQAHNTAGLGTRNVFLGANAIPGLSPINPYLQAAGNANAASATTPFKVYKLMPFLNAPLTMDNTATTPVVTNATTMMYKCTVATLMGTTYSEATSMMHSAWLGFIDQGNSKDLIYTLKKMHMIQPGVRAPYGLQYQTGSGKGEEIKGAYEKIYTESQALTNANLKGIPDGIIVQCINHTADANNRYETYVVSHDCWIYPGAATTIPTLPQM